MLKSLMLNWKALEDEGESNSVGTAGNVCLDYVHKRIRCVIITDTSGRSAYILGSFFSLYALIKDWDGSCLKCKPVRWSCDQLGLRALLSLPLQQVAPSYPPNIHLFHHQPSTHPVLLMNHSRISPFWIRLFSPHVSEWACLTQAELQ